MKEIPFGYTADEIKSVLNDWERIYDEVENGIYPYYDEVYDDGEYRDCYFFVEGAEFVVTSHKDDEKPHLADMINLQDRGEGYWQFCSTDLKEMLRENQIV